ncbi:MAG: CoA transferase [Actinomycetota bacterium]|nr:CoA transferase [Actinomycetota bacterium]
MNSALGPIRILDFSRVLAGPLATMVLADLGAEVIKVERPGSGDDTRQWKPPVDERGRATYFESVNRNKRSVSLDLRNPEDAEWARRMASDCDVLVENFRPGVMERLGFGYDALKAENPGLIYASITAFGDKDGAALPGYDVLVQAAGGLMSITGDPDGEPQKVGVALVDVVAGLFTAIGILAALRHRDETGAGQHVKVDLLSSLLASLVNQASAFTVAGAIPGRMGNAHPSISPYELYPCSGGSQLVLAVGTDGQFRDLCDCLPEGFVLAADERFTTNDSRVANRDDLRRTLIQRLETRTADEWVQVLSPRGVPAGVVNDVDGAFAFAASLGLEPTIEVPDEEGQMVSLPRNPINLTGSPATYRTAPPRLPEHSREDRPGWT